ncbi:hypothetical protein PIB30_038545, partial [Stylosanthes scabra]|nr:hypothetical protein [Stylosanthes scabra]
LSSSFWLWDQSALLSLRELTVGSFRLELILIRFKLKTKIWVKSDIQRRLYPFFCKIESSDLTDFPYPHLLHHCICTSNLSDGSMNLGSTKGFMEIHMSRARTRSRSLRFQSTITAFSRHNQG